MLRIITDTSCDMTKEELEKLNIDYISLNVSFGNETFKEEKDISKRQFYMMMKSTDLFPLTSQPLPNELYEILEDAKEKNDEVIGIFLSSKVSGTFNTCMMLKNEFDIKECYFVDSLTGSAGLRILINKAISLKDEGKCAKEIFLCLEELKKKIRLFIVADTLTYLVKGGRISSFLGHVATILKFKPLLVVKEGEIVLFSKPRGTKSAISELILNMTNDKIDSNYPIYGMYSCDDENMLKLADKANLSSIEIAKENIFPIGAVIGTHLGPNGFGVAYVLDE